MNITDVRLTWHIFLYPRKQIPWSWISPCRIPIKSRGFKICICKSALYAMSKTVKRLVNAAFVIQSHHGKKFIQCCSVFNRRRVPPECLGSHQLRFIHAEEWSGKHPHLINGVIVSLLIKMIVFHHFAVIEPDLS